MKTYIDTIEEFLDSDDKEAHQVESRFLTLMETLNKEYHKDSDRWHCSYIRVTDYDFVISVHYVNEHGELKGLTTNIESC